MVIYIHLIKLQYAHKDKSRSFSPRRSRGPAKIISTNIKFNKLDHTCGIPDDDLSARFVKAVENAIDHKRKNGLPIAMYDRSKRKAYLLHPDGI
jgi:hypothetical protein